MNAIKCRPITFTFYLVDGDLPFIIRLNLKGCSDTLNRISPSSMCFQRLGDTAERTFYTSSDEDERDCKRLRIEIVPPVRSSVTI